MALAGKVVTVNEGGGSPGGTVDPNLLRWNGERLRQAPRKRRKTPREELEELLADILPKKSADSDRVPTNKVALKSAEALRAEIEARLKELERAERRIERVERRKVGETHEDDAASLLLMLEQYDDELDELVMLVMLVAQLVATPNRERIYR
jgi:hypothetical protein